MKKYFVAQLFPLLLNIHFSSAQTWMALGKGVSDTQGAPWVYALFFDSSTHQLFAGGAYTIAGTSACPNLSIWKENNWQCFHSTGTPDNIYAFCKIADTLYFAGHDHHVDHCIINADGSIDNWSTLGTVSSVIECMIDYNGQLVVGGDFYKAGGKIVNGITIWDGKHWQKLSDGFAGFAVNDLTTYNGDLIAGGYFDQDAATGVWLNNIARWDGSNWQPLGDGLTDNDPNSYSAYVTSVEVYNGELYASGNFTYINNTEAVNHIAKWNGSQWTEVGNNVDAMLNDMQSYKGKLYGVHYFDASVGGAVAVYNGLLWQDLDFGYSGTLRCMTIFNDTMYVGGELFKITAAGDTAHNIAALDLNSVPTSSSQNASIKSVSIYPNPTNGEININYLIQQNSVAIVTDLSGRELKRIILSPSFHKQVIEVDDVPVGMYFITVKQSGKILASQKLVIERQEH